MRGCSCEAVAKRVVAAALACVLALGMCSCRPTDFFTEVIISPFADVVDEDNPEKSIVNSPDAAEESGDLAALDWSENAPETEETQNLAVYSSNPTTELTAHHSIFDLMPLFPGIEASDGVKLLYAVDSPLDEEAESPEQQPPEEQQPESESQGGVESTPDAQMTPTEQPAATTTPSDTGVSEPSESGGSGGGSGGGTRGDVEIVNPSPGTQQGDTPRGEENNDNNENPGEGDNPENESNGEQPDPHEGYEGEVPVYNPGDVFQTPPAANRIAVLGNDLAVLAQAIGGPDAVCAMSEESYYGAGESTAASSFSDVFAGEASDVKLLWSGDGSSPSDLSSVEALVEACGEDGVIYYDQRLGDQNTFFDDDQRRELYAASITLVPVDLSSVQGILDAASAVGDTLADSEVCSDSENRASAYKDAVRSIVGGVAAAHGGGLASSNSNITRLSMKSEYQDCPVGNMSYLATYGCIVTDIDLGLSSPNGIDLTDGVLFAEANGNSTPLFFWMQAAGVLASYSSNPTDDSFRRQAGTSEVTKVLWPLYNNEFEGLFSSGTGAYSRWLGSKSTWGKYSSASYGLDGATRTSGEGESLFPWMGLGSSEVPYLVVSATPGMDASEVKSHVVRSMTSGALTPYGAYPFSTLEGEGSAGYKNIPVYASSSGTVYSTVGAINAYGESPFYSGVSAEQTVRENPCGLLGSWTEGSMESVLEAVWLCDLYSRAPDNSPYDNADEDLPINDMSEFRCNIGGYECTTTEQAVTAFYQTFYRLSESEAKAAYDRVVTDKLEDL